MWPVLAQSVFDTTFSPRFNKVKFDRETGDTYRAMHMHFSHLHRRPAMNNDPPPYDKPKRAVMQQSRLVQCKLTSPTPQGFACTYDTLQVEIV